MFHILQLLSVGHLVSPEFHQACHDLIERLWAEAQKTKTPVDDIAVGALKALFLMLGLY